MYSLFNDHIMTQVAFLLFHTCIYIAHKSNGKQKKNDTEYLGSNVGTNKSTKNQNLTLRNNFTPLEPNQYSLTWSQHHTDHPHQLRTNDHDPFLIFVPPSFLISYGQNEGDRLLLGFIWRGIIKGIGFVGSFYVQEE